MGVVLAQVSSSACIQRHLQPADCGLAICCWDVSTVAITEAPPRLRHQGAAATTDIAAAGLDTLAHAVEAYVSIASDPTADASGLHAMSLVATYLRQAVRSPTDMRAVGMLAYAQHLASSALASASVGYVHAMACQLHEAYGLPQGAASAVLLPVVQAFNAQACPELFVDMAEAMGCVPAGAMLSSGAAVKALLGALRQLAADVGMPGSLKELGVDPRDFGRLADGAMRDACALTNPRAPTREEVVQLFWVAYEP